MMINEFIERTGFEPTGEEYREIEEEYMACNDDKDTFCKNWKKNGGIQRLTRLRARKIEQLEHHNEVLCKEKQKVLDDYIKIRNVFNDAKKMISDLEKERDSLKASLETHCEALRQSEKTVAELTAQIEEYKKYEEQLNAVKNLIAVLKV